MINPNNTTATNNLALILLKGTGDDINYALNLVKYFSRTNNPRLLDTLGWAYIKSGENLKAIEIFLTLIKSHPDEALFHYHLGYSLYHTDNEYKARKHLRLAVESSQNFIGKIDAKKMLDSL